MKRLFALSNVLTAAVLAFPVAAPAADMPRKAPVAVPVVSGWDGGYFGVSAGWKSTSTDWTTTCLSTLASGANCGLATNPFFVDASSPHTFTSSGGRVGGFIGANLQVSPSWLWGIEADLGWYDQRSTVAGIVGCTFNCGIPGFNGALDSTSVRLTSDGSLRLRLGFLATPDVLIYGTGGIAFQWMSESVSCNGPTSPWCGITRSQTNDQAFLMGWTGGGGVEWKFGHWTARGEYRYSEFDSTKQNFFAGTPDLILATLKLKTQIATFGLAYHY